MLNSGLIIGYIGKMGSGKTLSAVHDAYEYYLAGYVVYANIGLNFPHHKLTKEMFQALVSDPDRLQNAVLLIDEIHTWIDSRDSMTKKNKVISYVITQARKRGIRILFTTQSIDQVEKRLRNNAHLLVECNKVEHPDGMSVYQVIYDGFTSWLRDIPTDEIELAQAEKVYRLYDTREIVVFE